MKQEMSKYGGIGILMVIFLLGCSGDHSGSKPQNSVLQVAAAVSLTNVLQKVDSIFTHRYSNVTIEHYFAATSILARQLEQGAPFDVILSANPDWINYLAQKNKIKPSSITIFARNRLVLVAAPDKKVQQPLKQWIVGQKLGRIAVADWHHVPAGKYARLALEKMGLWQQILPYLIPAMDVRAALAYVEQKNAAIGIVYQSDALISNKVHFVPLPQAVQPDIVYEGALTVQGDSLASRYLAFLTTAEVQAIFQEFGFRQIEDSLYNKMVGL